jgi:hypothetical protein
MAAQYTEEKSLSDHPGVIFRDGPAGRRAALQGGPDVWEVMATMKGGKAHGQAAVHSTAELLNLTVAQVRAAVRYYAAFPDEVDRRIALNGGKQ